MTNKHFCQGPDCHTRPTSDRFLKSKGIIRGRYALFTINSENDWHARAKYFCSQGCESAFMREHIDEFIRLHPRTECLETPINDPTKERHSNSWHSWTETKIEVDESRQS